MICNNRSHLLRHSTLKISLERFMTISHSFSPSRLSITLGMMRNTFRSLLESPSDAKYPANNLSIWSKRIIHFYMRNETLVGVNDKEISTRWEFEHIIVTWYFSCMMSFRTQPLIFQFICQRGVPNCISPFLYKFCVLHFKLL